MSTLCTGHFLSGITFNTSDFTGSTTRWTPASLNSVACWYQAGTSVGTTSANLVTNWPDSSGEGVTLTPSNSSDSTTFYNPTGIGAAPCVSFAPGSTDNALVSGQSSTNVQFDWSQPFTVAFVFERAVEVPNEILLGFINPSNQGWYLTASSTPQSAGGDNGGVGFWLQSITPGNLIHVTSAVQPGTGQSTAGIPGTVSAGNNYLVVITYNGSGLASGVTMSINEVSLTPSVVNDSLTSTTLVTSAQQFVVGYNKSACSFGDILVFNTLLSAVQAKAVFTYLHNKYSVY